MKRILLLAAAVCMLYGCAEDDASSDDEGTASDSQTTTDGSNTTDATDSDDGADTTDASDATDSADTTDSSNASDATDSADTTDSMDTSDTVDGSDTTDTGDATDASDGTDDTDSSVVIIATGDESNPPASSAGDFCSDDSFGSATTELPMAPSSDYAFTTVLQGCSLNVTEAAQCYGDTHTSDVAVSGDVRTISGNAIPNHDVDLFPNSGNPSAISAQTVSFDVPSSPAKGTQATEARVSGVGVNGIKFEPETAERYGDTDWSYEALLFGGQVATDTNNFQGSSLGLDCNSAHVQPTGAYHYHGVPAALMPDTASVIQVGWAADGYPVLARYGYEIPGDQSSAVVELAGSYKLKDGEREALGSESPPPGAYDGTFVQDWEYDASVGDLDECNGRDETITIGGETFDYAYYLTLTYPFMPRCVWGEIIDSSFGATGGGGPGGGGPGGGGPGGGGPG
ncbi:MAG: YHYH protein [Myxococcota bacterium]|nr:YHYH protein [Myxococcota bacterium]